MITNEKDRVSTLYVTSYVLTFCSCVIALFFYDPSVEPSEQTKEQSSQSANIPRVLLSESLESEMEVPPLPELSGSKTEQEALYAPPERPMLSREMQGESAKSTKRKANPLGEKAFNNLREQIKEL